MPNVSFRMPSASHGRFPAYRPSTARKSSERPHRGPQHPPDELYEGATTATRTTPAFTRERAFAGTCEVGDPGLEPGTSSLSEKRRSNAQSSPVAKPAAYGRLL